MIELQRLSLRAGDFSVQGVDLRVPPGEYFVLLGPTGSGKTLLMDCICGLIRPTGGRTLIGGRDVTELEPRRRRIGYVPQDCGVFPHLDVARNLTFPLRARGESHRQALARITPLVEMLKLGPLLDRSPAGLSGGERQMVAVGRALAGQPEVLLLDEPVSALDEPTRRSVCTEIRRVQRELGVATVHVCHNLDEALAVADRAAILYSGRLVQTGTLAELMLAPRTETVGRLMRAENVFSGLATPTDDGHSVLSFAGREVRVPGAYEGPVRLMVRPEAVRVRRSDGSTPGPGTLLVRAEPWGPYCRLAFEEDEPIVAYVPTADLRRPPRPGDRFAIEFPPESVYVFAD